MTFLAVAQSRPNPALDITPKPNGSRSARLPFKTLMTWLRPMVLLLALLLLPAAARANPALLVDVDTGKVLYANEATRPWHPASTAKLMTVYLALKAIRDGKVSLDTPFAGTRKAAAQRPSKLGIKPGQIITLDNALKILLVKSANDLAYVIGEGLGGDADHFVAMMNAEAVTLGMRESLFTNPNGWHDPRMQVSARDLAILALALYRDFPEFRGYWGIGSVQLGKRVYKNTNGLIGRYDGAMGMKTGFVCASGFNVVALANRNGRTLLAVVLGAGSGMERTIEAAQLLDQGFSGVLRDGRSLADLPTSGFQTASDMRSEICSGHRKAPLTEEDVDGMVSAANGTAPTGSDHDSVYATLREQSGAVAAFAPLARRSGALGPRELGAPEPVYLGRAPGNSDPVYSVAAAAVRSKAGIAPDFAFEQTGAPRPGRFALTADPAPAAPARPSAGPRGKVGAPLRLGAIPSPAIDGASKAKVETTPKAQVKTRAHARHDSGHAGKAVGTAGGIHGKSKAAKTATGSKAAARIAAGKTAGVKASKGSAPVAGAAAQ